MIITFLWYLAGIRVKKITAWCLFQQIILFNQICKDKSFLFDLIVLPGLGDMRSQLLN